MRGGSEKRRWVIKPGEEARRGMDLECEWVCQPWVGKERRKEMRTGRGARKVASPDPIYNTLMSLRNIAALFKINVI